MQNTPGVQNLGDTMRNTLTSTVASIAFIATLLQVGPAAAQQEPIQLDEITVTAQKREQTLQDVPISISAMSAESIEERGFDNLTDLTSMVPNLAIDEGKIDSTLSIRGVITGQNKGFEQSVGMYVDGISYGRSQLVRLPIVDLQRVEVLRGPQPTLFGKNAIAGALNIVTAKPTDDFEAKLSASHEFEHDETGLLGVISGPFGDSGLKGRLVASYRDLEGYVTNTYLNRLEPQRHETYFRGQLAWDNDGSGDLNLKVEHAQFDTLGYPSEPNRPVGTYSALFDGSPFPLVDTVEDYRRASGEVHSFNDITNLVLTANFGLGDDTLTSVSGFVKYSTEEVLDVDFTQLLIFDGTNQTEHYEQISQEFRLTSPGGERLDYIAGVYFQSSDIVVTDDVRIGSFFASLPPPNSFLADSFSLRHFTQSSDLYSVFAQADFQISDIVTLTAGARYSNEKKDGARSLAIFGGPTNVAQRLPSPHPAYPNLLQFLWGFGLNMKGHSISGDRSEDSLDPLIRLRIAPNDTVSFHASYTQGSKAGGFDIRSNSIAGQPVPNPGTFEFEDETAENYEVGVKFRNDRVEFNGTVFRTDYEDLQTSLFDGRAGFTVQNASAATTQGIEVDGRVLAAEGFEIYGAAAYLDFEFTDFPKGQCHFGEAPNNGIYCNRRGFGTVFAPKWSGNVGFDYQRSLSNSFTADFGVNAEYRSKYFCSGSYDPRMVENGYTRVSAQVGISGGAGKWRVSLIGNNLTDERIMLGGGSLPLATLLTSNTGVAYDSLYSRPRNVTLKVDFRF